MWRGYNSGSQIRIYWSQRFRIVGARIEILWLCWNLKKFEIYFIHRNSWSLIIRIPEHFLCRMAIDSSNNCFLTTPSLVLELKLPISQSSLTARKWRINKSCEKYVIRMDYKVYLCFQSEITYYCYRWTRIFNMGSSSWRHYRFILLHFCRYRW